MIKEIVEIISTEKIKPSSPTPNNLKIFRLCSLDHLIPAPYAPIILFYPNHSTHFQVLEKLSLLKKSLSETLSCFFPLAGAINDNDLTVVNCDDQGAHFTTAKVKYHLAEFLDSRDLIKMLAQLLPRGSLNCSGSSNSNIPVSTIQANEFECGGIAIGICISHKLLDGTGLSCFLKSWGDATRSSGTRQYYSISAPDSSASSLFPVGELKLKNASMAMWGALFKNGRFVTKRLVFDESAVTSLKDEAAKYCFENNYTRVEVVSGFIWKHVMAERARPRPSLLTHVVNLRRRASPNFSSNSFGNLIWIAAARCNARELGDLELHALADNVRKSIAEIDGDYVKKLQGEEGSDTMLKFTKDVQEFGSRVDVDYFGFSSWCKLGFYDVDFGWGKPIWVSSVDSSGSYFMNLVVLMDTRCGSGIEAWVTLDEEEMARLEFNEEVRKFASLDPSPLDIGNGCGNH